MTLAMELERQKRRGYADGKAEGRAEGKAEGKFEVALCMLKKHFDYQTIAEMTQLSVDAIENLAKKKSADLTVREPIAKKSTP